VPDNLARLRAMDAASWMRRAYPPSEPMPAALKKIDFILDETAEPDMPEGCNMRFQTNQALNT
jgi:hypothetical protein